VGFEIVTEVLPVKSANVYPNSCVRGTTKSSSRKSVELRGRKHDRVLPAEHPSETRQNTAEEAKLKYNL